MTQERMTPGNPRRLALGLAAAVLGLCLAVGSVAAQTFEIPEGFVRTHEPDAGESDDWDYLFSVRPEKGAFSELSALHLREVTTPVADADAWLKERMTGDLGDFGKFGGAEDPFASPDSPFGDPAFDDLRAALPRLIEQFKAITELALKFCEGPSTGYNASGEFRELYCVFGVGPLRQYLVLRLQNVDERWFYTEIRTMNERRLRHLVAIANSFIIGG